LPQVDPAWFQRLNLTCDELLSNVAFKCNLRPYVMDDNKLLTLPNGERIRLMDHCKLLYEAGRCSFNST